MLDRTAIRLLSIAWDRAIGTSQIIRPPHRTIIVRCCSRSSSSASGPVSLVKSTYMMEAHGFGCLVHLHSSSTVFSSPIAAPSLHRFSQETSTLRSSTIFRSNCAQPNPPCPCSVESAAICGDSAGLAISIFLSAESTSNRHVADSQ
jgi:hypothetical protein